MMKCTLDAGVPGRNLPRQKEIRSKDMGRGQQPTWLGNCKGFCEANMDVRVEARGIMLGGRQGLDQGALLLRSFDFLL